MARVLVLGMATIDHVFRVAAFPDAAEKYRAEGYDGAIGGGAAIAAVAVARLGGGAALCARLADDAGSRAIVAGLAGEGVDTSLSPVASGGTAPVSSVLVDRAGERQIVNFRGAGLAEALPEQIDAGVVADFDAVLADTRWPRAAAALLGLARACGIPGVVDAEAPFEGTEAMLAAASHLAFSAQGLREFTGTADLDGGLARAAERLDGFLTVTDGAGGVRYLDASRTAGHVPAFPVAQADTLGAGDVWHGAFALALGEGRDEAAGMRFANAAAALKCRGRGFAAIPGRAETLALLDAGA